MESTPLGKIRELAWSSESVRVRRECVWLLTSGTAVIDYRPEGKDPNEEVMRAFADAGLEGEHGPKRDQWTFRLPGVKATYGPEDLFVMEGGE